MNRIEEKMKVFKDNKVVNWHEHVWFNNEGELDVELCDKMVQNAHETYMDKALAHIAISMFCINSSPLSTINTGL